jgi:hypothetical protein
MLDSALGTGFGFVVTPSTAISRIVVPPIQVGLHVTPNLSRSKTKGKKNGMWRTRECPILRDGAA